MPDGKYVATAVQATAGGDPEKVLEMCRAYIRGVRDSGFNIAVTAKHFPGDGTEERAQHLVIGCNDLSADEWEDIFGKVYRGLIDEGVEAVMAGHITQRALSKKYRPDYTDADIMPATLAPELLNDVLRGEMGFNAAEPGKTALPHAIAAGCDMILFANEPAEDMGYIREGLENGIIPPERLQEALERILGLKAKLELTENYEFPAPELREKYVGCAGHNEFRHQAAELCTTLVKDTQHLLLISSEGKRVFLVYQHNIPNSKAYRGDPVRDLLVEKLERVGFSVDVCPAFYDLEAENGADFRNFLRMMDKGSQEKFKAEHDLVLLVLNFTGCAQTNDVPVTWSTDHGVDQPRYFTEVPTVAVSLNLTNHLIDVPPGEDLHQRLRLQTREHPRFRGENVRYGQIHRQTR